MFWLKISLTLTFLQCMKEREICVRRGGGSTPKFSSPAAGTGSFSDIGFNCTTYLEHHSGAQLRVLQRPPHRATSASFFIYPAVHATLYTNAVRTLPGVLHVARQWYYSDDRRTAIIALNKPTTDCSLSAASLIPVSCLAAVRGDFSTPLRSLRATQAHSAGRSAPPGQAYASSLLAARAICASSLSSCE